MRRRPPPCRPDRYILWQSLKALKYMHSAQLLHRDMKPSNLLLNSDCLMKVADFGLARSLKPDRIYDESAPALTDYVATRWYRAPEILLGSGKYTYAVDMWAVGCILGEMLLGKPMFPGSSTMNQVEKIIDLTGLPSKRRIEKVSQFAVSMLEQTVDTEHEATRRLDMEEDELLDQIKKHREEQRRAEADLSGGVSDSVGSQARYDDASAAIRKKEGEAMQVVEKKRSLIRDKFRSKFPDANPDAIDLMMGLLHFEHEKRLTAEESLAHRYIQQFHDPAAERVALHNVSPSIDDDDKKSTAFYRDQLYTQISTRRYSKAPGGGQISGRDYTDGGASVRSGRSGYG